MKSGFTFLLLCCVITVYSQSGNAIKKKHSSYQLNLSFTPQLLLNGIDVENDEIEPEGISTKNTGGYTVGIEIERKNKKNFFLNLGLQFGMRHHDIIMGYERLSFFDPSSADVLNKLGPQIEHFSGNSSYWKLRLMVGYVVPYKILHGCSLELKTGISIRTYQTGFSDEYYLGIQFQKEDTVYISTIGKGYGRFGNNTLFQSWGKTMEGYIGLRKEINSRYLKDISIGLEFTRGVVLNGQTGVGFAELNSFTLYGSKNIPSSFDSYKTKDISIGLRISAGLWH